MHVKNANAPSERARGGEEGGRGREVLDYSGIISSPGGGWRHGIVGMHDGNGVYRCNIVELVDYLGIYLT